VLLILLKLNLLGLVVGNAGIEIINEKEVFVVEISSDGVNVLYYYVDAGNGYVFGGMSANAGYTFDRESVRVALDIVGNAKYIGGTSSYFSFDDGSAISNIDITKMKDKFIQ